MNIIGNKFRVHSIRNHEVLELNGRLVIAEIFLENGRYQCRFINDGLSMKQANIFPINLQLPHDRLEDKGPWSNQELQQFDAALLRHTRWGKPSTVAEEWNELGNAEREKSVTAFVWDYWNKNTISSIQTNPKAPHRLPWFLTNGYYYVHTFEKQRLGLTLVSVGNPNDSTSKELMKYPGRFISVEKSEVEAIQAGDICIDFPTMTHLPAAANMDFKNFVATISSCKRPLQLRFWRDANSKEREALRIASNNTGTNAYFIEREKRARQRFARKKRAREQAKKEKRAREIEREIEREKERKKRESEEEREKIQREIRKILNVPNVTRDRKIALKKQKELMLLRLKQIQEQIKINEKARQKQDKRSIAVKQEHKSRQNKAAGEVRHDIISRSANASEFARAALAALDHMDKTGKEKTSQEVVIHKVNQSSILKANMDEGRLLRLKFDILLWCRYEAKHSKEIEQLYKSEYFENSECDCTKCNRCLEIHTKIHELLYAMSDDSLLHIVEKNDDFYFLRN